MFKRRSTGVIDEEDDIKLLHIIRELRKQQADIITQINDVLEETR